MKDLVIQHKTINRVPWLLAFAALLLAGMIGAAWALPGRAAMSQTIPPPPTATPTPTKLMLPTPTWTPRPTWTRVPTLPPASPTPTVQEPTVIPTVPVPTASPTALPTEAVTVAPTLPSPVVSTPTSLPRTPAPSPSPTMTPPPIPLVCEIAVYPQVAGPADEVHFILQVANVGYDPIAGVVVSVSWPHDLVARSVDCGRCTIRQEAAQWHLTIGRLLPGEQVIVPILVQVAEDAWPGQLLETEWTLTADGIPPQGARAAVELPWAELPATGAAE